MFAAGLRGACLREIEYLRSHPWDLALVTWVPMLILTATWTIFAQGVVVKLPIALVDEDHSPGSRRVALAIDSLRSTRISEQATTLEEAWPLVRERRVYAVVHIPPDWERRSQRADRLPVVMYANEQFHAAGSTLASDVERAVGSVASESALTGLAHLGGGLSGARYRAGAVRVELRTLYGPQLSFERALAGVLLPAILHLFVFSGAAYAIGREFRDGRAGEWLDSAKGSITAALAGKLLPLVLAFGFIGLAIVAWFAGYRGWNANGSVFLWSFAILTLIAACCSIAAMFVGITGTLRVALSAASIINVTAISFAGLSYPAVSMSTPAKVWSSILPFKYYFDIQQQQWQIGSPVTYSLLPLGILWFVFILAPLAVALPKLRALCLNPASWGER